ncbi:MAG: hypothetical protein MUP74_04690 [Desulfobacterales bacterium]|nr:hypothetical protein [Desulfobacterales bacterium]
MAHEMRDPVSPAVLDRFMRLAAQVLDVPVVCVSLVDELHRRVVSTHGLCARSVTDGWRAPQAPRATARDGRLTAQAAMRLVTSDGRQVGTLTVMDRKPLRWSASQLEFLKELSVRIVGEVDIGPADRMM